MKCRGTPQRLRISVPNLQDPSDVLANGFIAQDSREVALTSAGQALKI